MSATPTRTGKIARLPKAIRDRLNQQMQDGVPGKDLVRWLNGHFEVRDVLLEHFNARDITEQNLSEWKQGGFQDWLKHQECRDWARRLGDEAEDLKADAGLLPLMERIGSVFEVVLGRTVEQLMDQPVKEPEQVRQLLGLSREVAKHRRLALDAAALHQKQTEQQKQQDKTMDERVLAAEQKAALHMIAKINQVRLRDLLVSGMSDEAKKWFDERLRELTREYMEGPPGPGFAEPSDDPDPTKSDSIRPDPTPVSAPAPSPPPQDMPAADPQESVKIDGSPKDRQASSA